VSESQASSGANSARVMSIIGIVLAVIAVFLFPIVFGPIAAILGFVAHAKGDKPLGLIVGIAAIVATVVGMLLGAAVMNSM
jgi:hypothetical protein